MEGRTDDDGFTLRRENVQHWYEVVTSREFLALLSKHQVEDLVTAASNERKRRFKRNRTKKYGNLNKGFTEQELETFLRCCQSLKARLAYSLMAQLGLRVGEVVRIKLEDVDLVKRRLFVNTEKAHTGDYLYLHDDVLARLQTWIDSEYDAIRAHDDFVLYSENPVFKRSHVSAHWLRNEFRRTALLAGQNEWYGKSEDSPLKEQRKLYRLTTHSLRHYFITKVYKTTKDPIVAQKLARHTDIKSTQVYIHTAQNDLDGSIIKTFDRGHLDKLREKEDLKKLVEVWQLLR